MTREPSPLNSAHHIYRYFPKIFGPKENEPLNKQATMEIFQTMTNEVTDTTSSS